MGILKGSQTRTTVYEFTPDDLKELITNDLYEDVANVTVEYVIQEVGGDPMDRYPGTKQVTKIRVTVK